MEVWAGKSNPAFDHLISPAPQQSESLPPVQLTCGVWCRPCLTLWLVVAACQCRLWAGPEVRVFPDCVSRGEGGGVKPNSPRPQWRGVSNKLPLTTACSLKFDFQCNGHSECCRLRGCWWFTLVLHVYNCVHVFCIPEHVGNLSAPCCIFVKAIVHLKWPFQNPLLCT